MSTPRSNVGTNVGSGAGPNAVVVGSGLAGALLTCFLARRGDRVTLCERRSDPRAAGFVGGRSINLALSVRGLDALERAGLADRVLADAIPMRGRMMHSPAGELTFQAYSKNPREAINSVSRGGLNLTLIEAAAAHENVNIMFKQRCVDVDLEAPAALFEDAGGAVSRVDGDVIIGADGAFSAVRGRLQKTDRFDYSQSYLAHGYKELVIPPTSGGDFALEPNALHIWPRGGSMMIALPNKDRTFTCTIFWPHANLEALRTDEQILAHFEQHYRDAVPLMPTLVEDYQRNPNSSLVTVRCHPWHYEDRVVLIGDAAHAIVPFFGQGMNAAFEDCVALDRCRGEHGTDWGAAFAKYTAARRVNGDAIADLALENFIEMRDRVASRSFLLRKKIEKTLHRLLPQWFTPLYNMVSFTTIPYAEARERAARQDRVLRGVALGVLLGIVVAFLLVILWILP